VGAPAPKFPELKGGRSSSLLRVYVDPGRGKSVLLKSLAGEDYKHTETRATRYFSLELIEIYSYSTFGTSVLAL